MVASAELAQSVNDIAAWPADWQDQAKLPDWAKSLKSHLRTQLLWALATGEISDLHPATVRAKGEGWWLRRVGFGRRSEQQLGAAIGGWETKPLRIELPTSYVIRRGPSYSSEQLEPLRGAVEEAMKALAALKAELDRLEA